MFLVLALSLPFAFVLWRRPILRRFAWRNLTRRPREAALVILGSMFGTAIITGSLVVGDTIDSSIRSIAYTRLGPIDEVVVTQSQAKQQEVLAAVRSARTDLVDGVIPVARLAVTAASGEGKARKAAPRAAILEFDFGQAARFGGDPSITGVSGKAPARGAAVVTEALADRLGVGKGDPVQVYLYGRDTTFRVARIVEAEGLAGFTSGFFDQPSHNLLVRPGTVADLTAGARSQIEAGLGAPPDWSVAISNKGGVEDGALHTAAVERRLGRALRGLDVMPLDVKRDILDEADRNADEFQQLFTAMGTFGVLAGILLLVNIFVMLGEERKPELGMMRAVGLRRVSLVGAFSTEGWMYSLAASAVGALVGLGLGRLIIEGVQRVFENDVEGFGLPLRFSAEFSSLQSGFASGFVIALVAVVLTSIRISRFNVIRAIRDLPEPRRTGLRLRWLVAGALVLLAGGMMTAASVTAENAHAARLLGPVFMVLGGGVLMARWFPTRGLVVAASASVIAWAAVIFPLTTGLGEAGIEVFVMQGVTLTAAAVVLVTQEHDRFELVARRLGVGGFAMAARLGLAYPVARRFRTGLTLAMYSLVIFTLTFITSLSATFNEQIDTTAREISGGYDVFVRSNPSNPVPVSSLTDVKGVEAVAPISNVYMRFSTKEEREVVDWGITGFDERLLIAGAPELADRGRYKTDEAAYRAVLRNPNLILTDQFFLADEGGPPQQHVEVGDVVFLHDPFTGERRRVKVAAQSADDFLFNGALYGWDHLRDFAGPRASENRAYVATVEGRALDVSARISGRFVEQGAEADPIRDLLAEFIAVQTQFFRLFQGYLGLGLLVGIAGLGVVMIRAVRDRRREIGVLRSLGFQASTVRRSFIFESAFVALEGTLIGVSLALVTAYNVMNNTEAFGNNASFTVAVPDLTVIVVLTLLASLLATAAPTRAAARIRPAVALRIAD